MFNATSYQIHDAHSNQVPEEGGTHIGVQFTVYLYRRRWFRPWKMQLEKWAISRWKHKDYSSYCLYRATRLDKDERVLRTDSHAARAAWYVKVYYHILELDKSCRLDLKRKAEPPPLPKPRLLPA